MIFKLLDEELCIFYIFFLQKLTCTKRHGVKVGPRHWDPVPRDPGTREPPQSLKVGPGTPLKFKSGTQDPLKSLKVGSPHLSLMNSFYSEYLIVFYLCVFFK